jgi:hypothetical protein
MKPVSRTKSSIGSTLLFVAGVLVSEAGDTGQPESLPARLPAEFETALSDEAFPEFLRSEEITLYCVTDVTGKGRPRHNTCLPNPDFDASRLQERVVKLMRKSRLSPAVLDGKKIATEFYYRIHLDTEGSIPRVRVYPNWGHSADLHGANYDAPQRQELRRFPPDCLFFVGVATTPVDENGRAAGETEVSTGFALEEPTLECIEIIKIRHSDGRYIPAHHDGKAVAAIHVEVWGDPEKYTLEIRGQE